MVTLPDTGLPIEAALGDIAGALADNVPVVLVAPPGSGKTTIVPLALLEAPWAQSGKIIVLEPRRVAARAAAARMASLLQERVGETVGYRVRFDAKVSKKTRIEIVTEGVFTRMVLDDPGLSDIACVIFDEFHERSLDTDLGLALVRDVRDALRDDMRLIIMSATLEGEALAKSVGARLIEADGRSFPVEINHEPSLRDAPLAEVVAKAVEHAFRTHRGSVLVFLPGQRDIERTAEILRERLDGKIPVLPLYGALSASEQDRAIAPVSENQRKVVLATAIAETSLTIEGVSIVVDCGLSRVPRYDPVTGLTRLETVRATKSAITQRAGRAGRTGPGTAIRLWREEETAGLRERELPEILNADLTRLALDLADWGVQDPSALPFLDRPSPERFKLAKSLLEKLGAVDGDGGITNIGRDLRRLPFSPRLASMIVNAVETGHAERAAQIALLLSERGLGGNDIDLDVRLERLSRDQSERAKRARNLARRIAGEHNETSSERKDHEVLPSTGALLALAFPDRIGLQTGQRPDGVQRFRLANGGGAEIEAHHPLARERFIVVADMIGRAGAARIVAAAPITEEMLRTGCARLIEANEAVEVDPDTGQAYHVRRQRIGAIDLASNKIRAKPRPDVEQALVAAISQKGIEYLQAFETFSRFHNRLSFLKANDHVPERDWPDMSLGRLFDELDQWLRPMLAGKTGLKELRDQDLIDGLMMLVPYDLQPLVDRLAPKQFETPSGTIAHIRYSDTEVSLSVRPTDLYGLKDHPSVLDGKMPVALHLVSPAGRPIQITSDLPGFWAGSWTDVRKDMMARYPKHFWPEDPQSASPSKRSIKRRQ
ncbi:MAG: ATP-dependent helicase HrpB [Pseudomonadota bacterium]